MSEKLYNDNHKYVIEYDSDRKEIYGTNYKNREEPKSFYTTKKRGILKAWEYIKANLDNMDYYDIIVYLDNNKLWTCCYCDND